MRVGELTAGFRIQVDRRSIGAVEGALGGIRRSTMGMLGTVTRFGAGIAGYFGAKHLGKAMIGFNANVENAKNQVATMLALYRKTSVAAQEGTASGLYDTLRQRAAELPGTTEDYVNMLSVLVGPLTKVNASVKEIEDTTVRTYLAAKGLGEPWRVAGRDIDELIMGKFGTVDKFARKLMEPLTDEKGNKLYEGTDGRARFKALSAEKRWSEIQRALNNPVWEESARKSAESFDGRMDKLKEAVSQFLGRAGKPLFDWFKNAATFATDWAEKNKEAIDKFADKVGAKLVKAVEALRDGLKWLYENRAGLVKVLYGVGAAFTFLMLRAGAAWLKVAWPVLAGAAVFVALRELFTWLEEKVGRFGAIAAGIFAAGMIFRAMKYVNVIRDLARAWMGVAVAQGAAGMGGAAGGMSKGAMAAQALGGLGFGGGGAGKGAGRMQNYLAGGAGAAGVAGKAAGLKGAAMGLGRGLPYIGMAIAGHELLEQIIPKGTAGSVLKHVLYGPLSIPKLAFEKAWDFFAGDDELSNRTWGEKFTNAAKNGAQVININVAGSKVDVHGTGAEGVAAWEKSFAELTVLALRAADDVMRGNRK